MTPLDFLVILLSAMTLLYTALELITILQPTNGEPMSTKNKEQEIKQFCKERLQEIADYQGKDFKDMCTTDLLHDIFNTDYYIVGRYQAKEWLGADAFDCIAEIQEWENMHFGESHTDFSEPEHVVNMYVYAVGYEIIDECFKDVCENYLDDQLNILEDAS